MLRCVPMCLDQPKYKLMNEALIDKARNYVKDLFREKYDPRATYHSFEHTREVADAALKIGKQSSLRLDELEVVVLAAWFHDTGYLFRKEDHESSSAETAAFFLRKERYPEEKIRRVTECILATRLNHKPENLLEEVIHDADFINLANTDNLRQSELLRQECINFGGKEPTQEEW